MGGRQSLPVVIITPTVTVPAKLENTVFPKIPYEVPAVSDDPNPIVRAQHTYLTTEINTVTTKVTALEAELARLNTKTDVELKPIKVETQKQIDLFKEEKVALQGKLDALGPSTKTQAVENAIRLQQLILSQTELNIRKEDASKSLKPALPNVVPNTTSIPTGCIYDIDNDGDLDSTYVGTYVYNTRSYTETVDFIDDTRPPERTFLERAPDVIITFTTINVSGALTISPTTPTGISGLCVDDTGNIYITESSTNTRIRKLTLSNDTYSMDTFAGGSTAGSVDGAGTAAQFRGISDICIWNGNIYVCDNSSTTNTNTIRKITLNGDVTTVIASIPRGASTNRYEKFKIDSNGHFFVFNKYCIQKITPTGTISMFAGSDSYSNTAKDGTGTTARFVNITFMSIDSNDNLYVVDSNKIRKITPEGDVSTFTTFNNTDKTVSFSSIRGICNDSKGSLYLTADTTDYDYRITKLSGIPNRNILIATIFAGTGTSGTLGGVNTAATFTGPRLMTFDSTDNMYVVDSSNSNILRKITTTVSRRTNVIY